MKFKLVILFFALAVSDATRVVGGLALVPEKVVRSLFSGENSLLLTWTNTSATEFHVEVSGTIFAASSTLAMPLPIQLKENLRLFPHQAGLMPLSIELPEVRGKTLFVIRWQDAAGNNIGNVELQVYPRDLLRQLGRSIGLMSEEVSFMKAFSTAEVEFVEIKTDEERDFRGKLLIIDGFARTNAVMRSAFVDLARRGVVVIWISETNAENVLRPEFFITPVDGGTGAIVFVEAHFVENFAENAASQLRLVEIYRAATQPGRPGLPVFFSKDQNEE